MPTYQYPAVYVVEVEAQVRPIEGVSTSTAASLPRSRELVNLSRRSFIRGRLIGHEADKTAGAPARVSVRKIRLHKQKAPPKRGRLEAMSATSCGDALLQDWLSQGREGRASSAPGSGSGRALKRTRRPHCQGRCS